MTVTRTDLEAIAAALNHATGTGSCSNHIENERRVCISKVADALQASNPRFDRQRFMVAAGWPAVLRDGKQWEIAFVAFSDDERHVRQHYPSAQDF